MTVEQIRVSSEWLDLREPADAAARSRDLVEHVRQQLPATGRLVIHDLACGSGSMGRWLAPLLPGRSSGSCTTATRTCWRSPPRTLRARPPAGPPSSSRRGCSDITRLCPDDLAGATLITASALLDLMTGDELAGLVDLCAAVACPVLLTLSVDRTRRAGTGRSARLVRGRRIRRPPASHDGGRPPARPGCRCGRRRALPPAGGRCRRSAQPLAARRRRRRSGGGVAHRMARCRLRAGRPTWPPGSDAYARRRLAQARAGQLAVTVDHADLLVLP